MGLRRFVVPYVCVAPELRWPSKGEMEVEFAMLKLETERFVEPDSWNVVFPDMQVNSSQSQWITSICNNMLHQPARKSLSAIVRMYDDASDVTDSICKVELTFAVTRLCRYILAVDCRGYGGR